MAKDFLTDYEVEQEIERLRNSEAVKLARKEQRIRYRQRQYLYTLRMLEKRGRALMEQGITLETLMFTDSDCEVSEELCNQTVPQPSGAEF